MKKLAAFVVNLAMGVSIALAGAAFLLPVVFGARPVVVLSGSMEPTLNVGGVALMEPVDSTTIKVGDIITFRAPDNKTVLVTHRVIEVFRQPTLIFQTQGDAVGKPDPFKVSANTVVGRVRFSIPGLGFAMHKVAQEIRTPLGFGLTMGVTSLILVVGEVRNIMSLQRLGSSRRAKFMKRRAERLKRRWPRAARRLR